MASYYKIQLHYAVDDLVHVRTANDIAKQVRDKLDNHHSHALFARFFPDTPTHQNLANSVHPRQLRGIHQVDRYIQVFFANP